MSFLKIDNATKSYGAIEVLHNVDISVQEGEFLVLVGPSGCGKSTLLNMIAGLEEITSGEIRIKDNLMNGVHPSKRNIAMVFQSYALYPHMSVRDNMTFGLRMAKGAERLPDGEIATRVKETAAMLELSDHLEKKPKELSGGQRQRVALGRALIRRPKVLLMDEPLSNLDAELRHQMRHEIRRLHDELGTTTIYVTHDQIEAMTLADRVAILDKGVLQQHAPPLEAYQQPANEFVQSFLCRHLDDLVETANTLLRPTGEGV